MSGTKIESLTKQQEEQLSIYRDKWLSIGLSTDPANRLKAEKGIEKAYAIVGLNKPKVVWCLSPLSSGLTRYCVIEILKVGNSVRDYVRDSVGASVRDYVRASVGASVGASVRDSVWDSVRDYVGDSVGDYVRASVGASVWDSVGDSVRDYVMDSVGDYVRASVGASVWASVGASVRASVWDSVRDYVMDSVGSSVKDSVRASVMDSVYGQHEAHWLGFYDYFNNVLRLEVQTEKLAGLWIVAQNAGWFIPHKNICWISERHNVCKLSNGVIHCSDGPAVAYPDGFSIYALNGVRVPKAIVETPAESLDAKIILKEKNAEIRREIVRKIGVEKVCKDLNAKLINKQGDYELLGLDIGDGRVRPYLKMLNPSIGTYHIEGVHPDCNTVEKALNWRNNTTEKPVILT